VNGLRRTILVLLGAQAALSVTAIVVERLRDCAACAGPGPDPAVLGAVGYGALLAAGLIGGLTPALYSGILFAGGVHAGLVAQMLANQRLCAVCLAAAGLSVALVAVSIACDRDNLGRLAVLAPGAALVAALGLSQGPPASAAVEPGGCVGILIYTQPECPYCERLRSDIMPEIEKEFGTRIRVEYRRAEDLPSVRRTPTLILESGRSGSRPRIIEGLPTLERLRGAIRDLEAAS